MTKIKFCGLSRASDIESANIIKPEYIGFVFPQKSKRYVSPDKAALLKKMLSRDISAVGVFVDEAPLTVAKLLNSGIIDIAQLHGEETEEYIKTLRLLSDKPIIKAFRIESEKDVQKAKRSTADFVLLDSGAGTGTVFNWELIENIKRPYFLAGGLGTKNAAQAVQKLHPYAVDVSSGIETNGKKDKIKMAEFAAALRKEDNV